MTTRIILLASGLLFAAASAMASPPPAAPVAPVVPAVPVPLQIVVYDQNDFKGNAITISTAVADLAVLKFDNKVASLFIKGAGDWVLCENKNYTGRCARVQSQAGNLKLFALNDRVSSLYPVPAPVTPPAATTTTTPSSTPAVKPH